MNFWFQQVFHMAKNSMLVNWHASATNILTVLSSASIINANGNTANGSATGFCPVHLRQYHMAEFLLQNLRNDFFQKFRSYFS